MNTSTLYRILWLTGCFIVLWLVWDFSATTYIQVPATLIFLWLVHREVTAELDDRGFNKGTIKRITDDRFMRKQP